MAPISPYPMPYQSPIPPQPVTADVQELASLVTDDTPVRDQIDAFFQWIRNKRSWQREEDDLADIEEAINSYGCKLTHVKRIPEMMWMDRYKLKLGQRDRIIKAIEQYRAEKHDITDSDGS
nr:hypothetical protein CFP56_07838 [Quercus suber]